MVLAYHWQLQLFEAYILHCNVNVPIRKINIHTMIAYHHPNHHQCFTTHGHRTNTVPNKYTPEEWTARGLFQCIMKPELANTPHP